jgi:hypothetical protein
MMKEELTTHNEEGDVVGCPRNEEETSGVIEAGASTCNCQYLDILRG